MLHVAAVEERILAAREPGLLAHELRHQAAGVASANQKDTEVAMQRRDEIAVLQRCADSGADRFLARAGIDAAHDFVLAMEPRDALLERPDEFHPVVELEFVFDPRAGFRLGARTLGLRHR